MWLFDDTERATSPPPSRSLRTFLRARRPVVDALKDWGLSHRFAGSKDRAAIASLVYDALRRKASAAWIMGQDDARAVLLGMLRLQRGHGRPKRSRALFSGERFAPAPLTDSERDRLETATLDGRAGIRRGRFPRVDRARRFATSSATTSWPELQGLATRAPLDLRVNRLKAASREGCPRRACTS